MSRARLILLGIGLLLLGTWLTHRARPVSKESTTVLSAFGRSLGGFRVLVENALYLRAERLRREGRPYDAVALYNTLVELDPASDAATTHLVDVQAGVMLEDIQSPERRFRLWRDVLARVRAALKRHPDSARLEWRAAELLLSHYVVNSDLNQRIDAAVPDRNDMAFDHLHRSVMLSEELPRRGRLPLHQFVCIAPVVAADALLRGDLARAKHVLGTMRRIAALRDVGLADLRWGRGDPNPELPLGWAPEDLVPMRDVLSVGIRAIEVLFTGPYVAAEAAVARYADAVGPCLAVDRMRARLEQIAK